MVLGLVDQLQIYGPLYLLIELLGLLIGLGLCELLNHKALINPISKAFDRVWHPGLLHKLKCYGISGQIFGLISLSSS